MYDSSYNKLFWGMIILGLNVSLMGFSVRANIIGYILIFWGLTNLSSANKTFEKGKLPCIILVLFSLIDIHGDKNINFLADYNYDFSIAEIIVGQVVMVTTIYLIFNICKGIYEICEQNGLEELKSFGATAWKFYFIVNLITMFSIPFYINAFVFNKPIIIILAICSAISLILLLILFRKCKNNLGDFNLQHKE